MGNKMFYTIMVSEEHVTKMEDLLNGLRVSLNDWDKTKAFDFYGGHIVGFTMMCTKEVYEIIYEHLYSW